MSLIHTMSLIGKTDYVERNARLPDGDVIHYAEGPKNDKQPLLLIHGQGGTYAAYQRVLKDLGDRYHVFAVDCAGHGKSSHNPEKYTAAAMGQDMIRFIRHVMGGKPVLVSGHCTGGLLAIWLAANAPQLVRGLVLENPPIFSTMQGGRLEHSFAYLDTYRTIHGFLNQTKEKDWSLYYLQHSLWKQLMGKIPMKTMLKHGKKFRHDHPCDPLYFWYLPDSINRKFQFWDTYDLRFGDAFYDGSWLKDFDMVESLQKITCPTVLIHTRWSVNQQGILMAAMSGPDVAYAMDLMPNAQLVSLNCGHEAHHEKPKEFVNAFHKLEGMM